MCEQGVQAPDEETLADMLADFKRLDVDGSGSITMAELEAFFVEQGMPEDEIEEAIHIVSGLDKDRNGDISFSEFVLDRLQAMMD